VPLAGPVVLTPRDHSLTVGFAALAFTNPARNRYAYRLEGLGSNWVNTERRRFVTLAALAPGHYRLQLRGSNEDGVWSTPARSVAIIVQPPFWQTSGFRLAALALLAAVIWALYRRRVSHLLALERVRLRIAGDLHDDLSTDLAGIAVAADSVAGRADLPDGARRLLLRVRDSALGLADGVRDVVWALDPEHDTLESTIRRMRRVADTLLAGKEWTFAIAPEATRGEIAMAQRRNLLLVLKEALHNVVRHANAQRVAIDLSEDRGALLLVVADDGVGFDPGSDPPGRGLASMRRRAAELGGTLTIDSSARGGTRLMLRIPRTRDRHRG
ncbi:MAG TPA: triple tyrosine motif-containing protein, partial [Thermoanaerobaculia bacterium]|nr:triple tyrosine motif-containing protein [Thermoanaerobaculia bacterium]